MYTGTGDGRWDPENGIFGNGIIGVKQNPETKALELDDYYGANQCRVAGEARLGHAGYSRDLQLQGS